MVKKLCPFLQKTCRGEECNFYIGNQCIISQYYKVVAENNDKSREECYRHIDNQIIGELQERFKDRKMKGKVIKL